MLPPETITTIFVCLQQCVATVSSECQEAIYALNTNCSMMLKTRPQPPNILRSHRTMDAPFNPSAIAGQLYNPTTVDPIAGISTSLANLNLGGPTNSAFNLQGGLGPLVASPGSPSRILNPGPSNSPYPVMSMQHQGPVGAGAPIVPNVNLARIGPNPGLDKPPRVPDANLFPEIAPNVSKDIEDEANSYFQRIYNHPPHPTLSIDEVLDMLKRFQDSPLKREREVSLITELMSTRTEYWVQIENRFSAIDIFIFENRLYKKNCNFRKP